MFQTPSEPKNPVDDKLTVEQKTRVSKEKGDVAELIQNVKVQRVEKLIKRITYRKDEPGIYDLTAMISERRETDNGEKKEGRILDGQIFRVRKLLSL